MDQQFQYKYGINVDGLSDSEKLISQLIGPQLMFKQHSPYYPWYWRHYGLQEGVHYVNVRYDLQDLPTK